MSILKNTEYYGLAKEVFGKGNADESGDDTTRTLSEYSERRFNANNEYLVRKAPRVCYTPFTNEALDSGRSFSALKGPSSRDKPKETETTVNISPITSNVVRNVHTVEYNYGEGAFRFMLPVYIHPLCKRFRLHFTGQIEFVFENESYSDDWTNASVGVQLSLRSASHDEFLKSPTDEAIVGTNFSSDRYQDFEIWESQNAQASHYTVETENIQQKAPGPVDQPTLGLLMFRIKSFPADYGEGSNQLDTDANPLQIYNNNLIDENSDSDLDFSNVTDSSHLLTDWNRGTNNADDIVFINETSSQGSQFGSIIRYNTMGMTNMGSEGADQRGIWLNTGIDPNSWMLEEVWDPSASGIGYAQKDQSSMDGRIVVGGADVSQQGENLDTHYNSPILKAIGPRGSKPVTDTADISDLGFQSWDDKDNGKRWNFAFLNHATSDHSKPPSLNERLDIQPVKLDKGDSIIEFKGLISLISVDDSELFMDSDGSITRHSGLAWNTSAEDRPTDPSMVKDGEVELTLGIGANQGFSTNTLFPTNTIDIGLTSIYRATLSEACPMLLTQMCGHLGSDINFDKWNEDFQRVWSEGLLYTLDLPYMTFAELDLEISTDDFDFDRPVNIWVWVDDAQNLEQFDIQGSSGNQAPTLERTKCTLFQSTYYELGN